MYRLHLVGTKLKNDFSYFYYLIPDFIKACSRETEQVHENMIAELVQVTETNNYDRLMFVTCQEYLPFSIVLTYSSNVTVNNEIYETPLLIAFLFRDR